MKKIYLLFLAVPLLAFTLMWLSVWWFVGGVIAVMAFIAYRFYESRLEASHDRNVVLEEELEQLNVQLENAVIKAEKATKETQRVKQAKQELLAIIGHEIRTPMNGIMGMALLLEDTSMTTEQKEYVNTIKNSGEVLLTAINNLLVNDIIDFAKLQQEGSQLEYKSFELRDSIEEVLELFARKAGEANLELAYHMNADVPQLIIGDSKRLRQVLTNLVENAVKFTTKGEILINVHRNPSKVPGYPPEVRFEIKDTGAGIMKEQLKHLFKGIPPKEAGRVKSNEQVGLGLIVCKKIVELMGGNIEVQSQPGQGSTFSFSIPVTPSLRIARDLSQQSNIGNLEGKKVLVVDDNATSLTVIVDQLKQWKTQPFAANSGTKALELLSKEAIDIVLVDIVMPAMNGHELASMIKKIHADLPVIAMNYPGEQKYEKSIFQAIINKPVRRHVLKDQLLSALSGSSGNKDNTVNQMSEEFSKHFPLRILVAEDNLVNQKIAEKILSKLGYEPALANHGKEVMELVGQDTYDIILMDVQMPEMNGLEATRMIRTCLETQPIIIAMTANVMQGDRDECLQAGMDDYMSKPIELPELLGQLEKWSLVLRERKKMSA